MDIEAFYEANEARRESAEVEFGSRWSDALGNSYELSWVEATGEIYLMIEPDAKITEDAFGDFLVSDERVEDLSVVVVATIATLSEVTAHLEGWQDAEETENSLTWLASKLRVADK